MGGRPATASLAFKRGAATVAFDVHLEDGGMMNQAVDDCDRHCLVWEDLAPFAERLIGSDEERSPLVPGADKLKEDAGFSLVFLPPYSPELNPIERLWLHLRDNRLSLRFPDNWRDRRHLL